MKFKDMSEEQFSEWFSLRDRYFDPYDCWDAGCYDVDEELTDDLDEYLVCGTDFCCECPMYEKWKLKNEKKST